MTGDNADGLWVPGIVRSKHTREIIAGYGVQNSSALWDRLRSTHGAALQALTARLRIRNAVTISIAAN
jgi:hypothetical protein